MRTKEVQIKVKRYRDKTNGNSYHASVIQVFGETGECTIRREEFAYDYENACFNIAMAGLRAEGLIPSESFARDGWEVEKIDFGFVTKRECKEFGIRGL